MNNLSKSRFLIGQQCAKQLWWTVREPDAPELKPATDAVEVVRGRGVGELAREHVGSRRGKPYLDFCASHRMTNPRHHRIHASGGVVWLPAERDMFVFASRSTEAQTAAKESRFDRQNARVATLLRKKFATVEATLPEDPGAK